MDHPATALLTALAWWATAPGFALPSGPGLIVPTVYVLAVWTMVPLAFIDLDVHRLPDRIQLPAYPILLALLALCSLATGDWGALIRALVAGVTLFVLFFVLALLPGGASASATSSSPDCSGCSSGGCRGRRCSSR